MDVNIKVRSNMYFRRPFMLKFSFFIYFNVYLTLFSGILTNFLGFSSAIIYISDFITIILLIELFTRNAKKRLNYIKPIKKTILLYLMITLIGGIISISSIFLFIWGYRTLFKGIAFFLATCVFLKEKDIYKIYNSFFYIQIINLLLSLYEYFGLGLYQDTLGGIFGYGNGALLNPFHAMIFAYYLNLYLNKKSSLSKVLFISGSALLISALAEEKAFFIYFILILFIVILMNRPSHKTIFILVFVCVAAVGALRASRFPRHS